MDVSTYGEHIFPLTSDNPIRSRGGTINKGYIKKIWLSQGSLNDRLNETPRTPTRTLRPSASKISWGNLFFLGKEEEVEEEEGERGSADRQKPA